MSLPGNTLNDPPLKTGLFGLFSTPTRFLTAMAVYFALHIGIRAVMGGAANLDESEQLLLGQRVALGYGPQPPLYTWLQIGVFTAAGTTIFALALLKNVLLFCSYSLAYFNGRLISGRHWVGVIAALSLFFIPQVAWESQRDLTHSVLAATLSLATLYAFLKACSTGRSSWYLLLGAALGCGMLAKYNYALWAAGLLVAGIWVPVFRKHVLCPKMAMAAALAAIIVVPHVCWAVTNSDLAMASSSKLALDQSGNWFATRAFGLGRMLFAAGSFILPLVAVYGISVAVGRKEAGDWSAPPESRLIGRALAVIGVLLVFAILAFGATGFKDRWFQPLLVCVPVAAATSLALFINSRGIQCLQGCAVAVMVVVAMLIPGKVLFASLTGREERLNLPYTELSRQLASSVKPGTLLVADSQLLGGNLRLAFPGNAVEVIGKTAPAGGEWMLVWDARKRMSPPAIAGGWLGKEKLETRFLEAHWRNQPDKTFRIGVISSKGAGA